MKYLFSEIHYKRNLHYFFPKQFDLVCQLDIINWLSEAQRRSDGWRKLEGNKEKALYYNIEGPERSRFDKLTITFKGTVNPKINHLSWMTNLHFVSNLSDFLFSVEDFDECPRRSFPSKFNEWGLKLSGFKKDKNHHKTILNMVLMTFSIYYTSKVWSSHKPIIWLFKYSAWLIWTNFMVL